MKDVDKFKDLDNSYMVRTSDMHGVKAVDE